jgi:phosphatidylglycerophosphate synthase
MNAPFIDRAAAAADRAGGWYQRWVLRPLSVPLSQLLLRAGVPPVGATFLGLGTGLAAAAWAAASGGALWAAAVVWHVAKVLDFADGNLARALKAKTVADKMLDGLVDVIVDGAFLVAVGFVCGGWALPAALSSVWLAGLGAFARFRYLHFLAWLPVTDAAAGVGTAVVRTGNGGWAGAVRGITQVLERFDRETVIAGLFVSLAVGRPELWVFGVSAIRGVVGVINTAGSIYLGARQLAVPRGQ